VCRIGELYGLLTYFQLIIGSYTLCEDYFWAVSKLIANFLKTAKVSKKKKVYVSEGVSILKSVIVEHVNVEIDIKISDNRNSNQHRKSSVDTKDGTGETIGTLFEGTVECTKPELIWFLILCKYMWDKLRLLMLNYQHVFNHDMPYSPILSSCLGCFRALTRVLYVCEPAHTMTLLYSHSNMYKLVEDTMLKSVKIAFSRYVINAVVKAAKRKRHKKDKHEITQRLIKDTELDSTARDVVWPSIGLVQSSSNNDTKNDNKSSNNSNNHYSFKDIVMLVRCVRAHIIKDRKWYSNMLQEVVHTRAVKLENITAQQVQTHTNVYACTYIAHTHTHAPTYIRMHKYTHMSHYPYM